MKRFILFTLLFISPAAADESKPMDLNAVEPELVDGFMGPWQIVNSDGEKTCDVNLLRDETIGGMKIEITDDCAATFPVMGEIAAWRLYENWEIVLVDAERKERIRFTSDEAGYTAEPKTDGIDGIVAAQSEINPAE